MDPAELHTALRLPRFIAVLLAAAALLGALIGSGCGGGSSKAEKAVRTSSSPAARKLERADLAIVSHGLVGAERTIEREVQAAKAAWPAVAHGLPAQVSAAERRAISRAGVRAQRIATPRFISYAGELTGAAAAIAGLLLSYEGLTQRGWTFTLAAANHAHVRFLRTNASLYIGCVYDGHYNLSSIGEYLLNAYRGLGGAAAFGSALTQGEVEGLARFYSPTSARLQPRPPASPTSS